MNSDPLLQEKAAMRRAMARVRDAAGATHPDGAEMLAGHAEMLAAQFTIGEGTVIAGYWPIKTELNPLPLMKKLAGMGAATALPQTPQAHAPLAFRLWREGEALTPGPYGTSEPPQSATPCTPDIILTPLLAFDKRGYRLGYGGGFYDRTLTAMPRARAIGIAYGEQKVERVPEGVYDHPLEAVLTPDGFA